MTRASLTAALATARAGLHDHRASARILALLAGGAAVLVAPLLAFFTPFEGGRTTLRFSSVPAFGYDLGWTGAAITSATTQQAAVRQLFELLIASGLLMFGVAAGSMLLIAASIAGERAAELAVRRAVGASRRTLVAAALAEATIVGAAALGWGGASPWRCSCDTRRTRGPATPSREELARSRRRWPRGSCSVSRP